MNLYEFTDISGSTEYYTTAKTTITFDNNDFIPKTFQRSAYTLDSIIKKTNITITFTGDDVFANRYLHPTVETLTVVIRTLEGVAFYRGRLVTVRYHKNRISMVFEPIVKLGNEYSGERRIYQRSCPYELYGDNCRATRYNHNVITTSYLTTTSLRVRFDTGDPTNDTRGDEAFAVLRTHHSSTANVGIGRLVGGLFASSELGVDGDFWITKISDPSLTGQYVDFTVTLFRPFRTGYQYNTPVDVPATVAFGCLRTTNDCEVIHDNLENFGGFAGLIKVSPFQGGIRG